MQIESSSECGQRANGAPVGAQHNVSDLQSARLGRTSRRHVIDYPSPTLRQPQSLGQVLGNGLRARFDLDAMHVSILANTFVDELHDSCRNRKSQALAPTG